VRTKPWTGDNRTAYDRIDDLTTVVADYKGCRRAQHFIATPGALEARPTKCPTCTAQVKPEDGNRGIYDPKSKRFVVQHYACAWESLLTTIAKIRL